MAYKKLRGYKRRMKNIKSQVPKGHYCYGHREDGKFVTCPFWKLNKHLDKQENGICLAFNRRDGTDTMLLWDMIKSCNINDE
jgi:hypothetical protein